MFVHCHKATRRLITFMVVGLLFAVFASTASAECGPGFSSKSQLIQYYKNNPSAEHGFRQELLAHKAYTGFQADETVLNWLRSPEQRVFAAPRGYRLKTNTFCPSGEGQYQPFPGLLENMSGKLLLWHCSKSGKCVPILKGYCMNFVTGPPVQKHHKPKCKCHKRKHHKPKPKPEPSCEAQGLVTVAGNCVSQSNAAKQECEAKVNGQWNGNQCTIVQINANCSNVAGNEGGTVVQGGNCNTTVIVEEKSEPAPPAPPVIEWERIQEMFTNHERNLCVTVTPASGVSVQFGVKYGQRSNGGIGVYNASTNKYCVTYTAPSEEPPHVCEEAIASSLPAGTKCDIANVAVFSNNGAKTVYGKMEIPILKEESQVVW